MFLNEFSRAGDGSDGSGSSGSGSLALNEAECYATMAHFLFRFRRNFLVNNEGILVRWRPGQGACSSSCASASVLSGAETLCVTCSSRLLATGSAEGAWGVREGCGPARARGRRRRWRRGLRFRCEATIIWHRTRGVMRVFPLGCRSPNARPCHADSLRSAEALRAAADARAGNGEGGRVLGPSHREPLTLPSPLT